MEYITTKSFNTNGIGGRFNLTIGTPINENNNILYFNNLPICYKTSQYAYDYFSRNDDEKGLERFALVEQIKQRLKDLNNEYNENVRLELEGVEDLENYEIQTPNKVAITFNKWNENGIYQHDNINTFEFYNMSVQDLQQMYELMEE